jgi:pimeloyl-ACP methyl ester carboxylesterase
LQTPASGSNLENTMSALHPLHRPADQRAALLCLHSSGGSGRQWKAYAAPLAPRFRIIAPDLLGYAGNGHWPSGTPASLDDEAQALAVLLPPDGAHMLGHSYGGSVALQLALRWPERVKSLTLYEPVRFALLFGEQATETTGEAIVGVGRRIGMEVLSGALHAAAARFVDYWSGDGAWAALDERRRGALAQRMPKVHAEFEALFADRVPAAAYRRLTMPVRLLGGSRSPLPARQVLDRLEANLPNVTRATLAGLGHMGPVEAPERILPELDGLQAASLLPQAA